MNKGNSMSIDVVVPQIGESITSVFIARWMVQPGQAVKAGQPILEVDSDKATLEVPAVSDGVLIEQLAAQGDEVLIGAVVGRLGEGGGAAAAPAPAAAAAPKAEPEAVRAGPAARQEAEKRGVDLASVEGSAKHGRVTSDDVRKAGAPAAPVAPQAAPTPAAKAAPAAKIAEPVVVGAEPIERVPMTPLRRTIARRLVEAQQTAAMLTTFNEVDMSAIMALRAQYQDRFVKRYGIKLGFMSFFVKAAIEALKQFPAVNAEIDGTDILYKHFYHVAIAVSGPKGLVVPVIRHADRLSFAETEQAIATLGTRAKDNKLTLEDFQGGTFTISNGGIFGSMLSTPILNAPQVGILGMHNIVERPVAIDGKVEIRPIMYLALSYDHRIIDGREAVSFLVRIKECLEDPERILLEV
jgi:2-oxoglutarate dehydrogenase E2 component (dihydrolipoamide succinyltransferase)